MNVYEYLDSEDYYAIIRAAEQRGYVRSAAALARESEEGSIGQMGVTLDEACHYLEHVASHERFVLERDRASA